MNRVVLCGRLAGRPKIAYTPGGVAVATFRLTVPRAPSADRAAGQDEIDCVAFRQQADALHSWGDRGVRANIEGRLRLEDWRDDEGQVRCGLRVHVDHAYRADPEPGSPLQRLRGLLPGPGANGHAPPVPAERAA